MLEGRRPSRPSVDIWRSDQDRRLKKFARLRVDVRQLGRSACNPEVDGLPLTVKALSQAPVIARRGNCSRRARHFPPGRLACRCRYSKRHLVAYSAGVDDRSWRRRGGGMVRLSVTRILAAQDPKVHRLRPQQDRRRQDWRVSLIVYRVAMPRSIVLRTEATRRTQVFKGAGKR